MFNESVAKANLKDEIYYALTEQIAEPSKLWDGRQVKSLESPAGYPDQLLALRINYGGDNDWNVSLGRQPGNAYRWADNEYFLDVGIESDSFDWPKFEDYSNADNFDVACNDTIIDASARHIDYNLEYWLDEVMSYFFAESEND